METIEDIKKFYDSLYKKQYQDELEEIKKDCDKLYQEKYKTYYKDLYESEFKTKEKELLNYYKIMAGEYTKDNFLSKLEEEKEKLTKNFEEEKKKYEVEMDTFYNNYYKEKYEPKPVVQEQTQENI